MSFTNVFGGNTIYPSDVSYLAIALSVDTPLEWPLESSGLEDPAARIIDVTPAASGSSVILPDATLTGAGQTILFNNVSGSFNFYVKDFAGNTLATVGYGEQWQVYLAATTTPAGTWRVFRYGASTATVQPSALAGFGLTVTGSTLSQSLPVAPFSTTGLTVATSSRASAFVWTGTGAGTLNLLTAASAGNNFFVLVRNEGGGDLTIDPSGTETINNGPTLVLRPGDSCTVITDGVEWYTVGLGQEPIFAFDYTSISVTGGNYTLAGSELNRIAYKFVGTLTSDLYVIIPATVQQYWITNATTGSFNFFVKIAGGTPIQVNSGAKGIYYCDGTNVILASDPTSFSLPVIISQGGTGSTTASGARLNLGITTFADPIVTATTGATVRTTIGAAASGANNDITSLTGLTTALSVAQGGTGAATLTGYVKGSGTTALTASSTIPGSDISGTVAVANGGTGQTSYTDGQLLIGNTTGNTLAKTTLTAGSNITITNGAGAITIAASGTSLTNWTEGVNTAAPNATVPVVSFTATNAATNVDAALVAKGTGALVAQIADNTAAGGNKRGTYAVDWQHTRLTNTQVASGANSVIGGGYYNTASNISATVAGGSTNNASGDSAVIAGGFTNTCSGQYSALLGGTQNAASGTYSAVLGGANTTASGSGSATLGGQYNVADGSYSTASGTRATTRGAIGEVFGQSTIVATTGVSQKRGFILGRETTAVTATVLAANASAASATNQVNLANNSAFYFKGFVVANVTGGGNTKGWFIEGVIKRGATAASTALVGTPTVTSNYADAGASTWTVTATADTTNGCLAITVAGQATTTIRWVANIETTEVTY
jgi:hypothetical protein